MPLARIIEKEGFAVDPRGATAAGLALARKCLRLGGEWLLKDDFAGSVNFLKLKLRKEFQEELEESWALFMKSSTSGKRGTVGAGDKTAGAAAEATSGTGAGAGRAAKAAASNKRPRGAETDKDDTPGKSRKAKGATTKLDAALAEAKVLK